MSGLAERVLGTVNVSLRNRPNVVQIDTQTIDL